MMGRSKQNEDNMGADDYGKGHTQEPAFGSSEGGIVRGPGPVDGAGEVVAGGPGRAARRRPGTDRDQGGQPPASGRTPRELQEDDSSEEE